MVSLIGGVPVKSAGAQAAGPQYIVREGDTLFDIAQDFGLTVEVLQAANPAVNPEALTVGLVLTVPGFEGVTGTLNTQILQAGETLDSLALSLGLQRESLVRLNGVVNPDMLYINEPAIIVDEPDAGPPLPTGITYVAVPGHGLVELAAEHGQNAWALASTNRLDSPAALRPGASVVVPGGEAPTLALPYPLQAIQLSPLPLSQGRTVSIQIDSAVPVTLTGNLGESPLNFNGDAAMDTRQFALQGIYRLAEPNLYALNIIATDASGQSVVLSQRVAVGAGDYLVDRPLTVDPATLDPVVSRLESEQIRKVASTVTPQRLWEGPMVLPSVGAFRSMFGSLRSYNGGPYDSFHGGVDFSGGEDRPITAPANGTVVFTGALTVRGGTTFIDHGWGVFTGYLHQSQILVTAGDRVETGQIIGYQGQTGRVTGPHLHWELWVGGNQVDPLQWTEVSFP